MTISRRQALTQLGGMAASVAAAPLLARDAAPVESAPAPTLHSATTADFPRKADFAMAEGYTYLNGAYTHPMPKVAAGAMRQWAARREKVGGPPAPPRTDPRVAYAARINADPSEIAFIPNTSTG